MQLSVEEWTAACKEVLEYDGGYDDFVRQHSARKAAVEEQAPSPVAKPKPAPPAEKPVKLSFKEKRELEQLPGKIEELEQEQARLHEQMADPAFFRKPPADIAKGTQRVEELGTELSRLYDRWTELADRE